MRIYVASSWRNKYQSDVVKRLRQEGHIVYDFKEPKPGIKGFAWSDIDVNWQKWTPEEFSKALNHEIAVEGFANDLTGMTDSDACVMVMPCGRSAHTELGHFIGAGKLSIILIPEACEPELMYKLADAVCTNIEEVVNFLK